MTSHSTFISFGHSASPDFKADKMKLCLLWFDEIIYDNLGGRSRDQYLSSLPGFESLTAGNRTVLFDALSPVRERVDLDWDARLFEKSRGYPRWGEDWKNYDYPEPESGSQAAHNALLRKIEAEHGVDRFVDGYDIQQVEGRAGVAVDAVGLWRDISAIVPCVMQANSDEAVAISAERSFAKKLDAGSAFALFEASVPSLAHLDWKTIVEIKSGKSFARLRSKMEAAYQASGSDLDAALSDLRLAERDAADEIIDRSRPRPFRALIEGIMSNIPGFAVNPFSVLLSLNAFRSELSKSRELDWFYMMRDLRPPSS